MKPFDLMAAINGESVITNDKQIVRGIHIFCNKVFGVIHDEEDIFNEDNIVIFSWDKEGNLIYNHNPFDIERMKLFMAPKKKKLWIRVKKMPFIDNNMEHDTSHAYEDRQALGQDNINYNFIEIEIEE